MDLAWGTSPKFEGLSDCVCFWHKTDVPLALTNVCFEGKNEHDTAVTPFPLITDAVDKRFSRRE
jgi:hypothetical protein